MLRLLSKLPKEMSAEVRDASGKLASATISGALAAAPNTITRRAIGTMTVRRDRVPAIASTWPAFFGAEFGGGKRPTTRQFMPHLGRTGYALYPYVRREGARLAEQWAEAVFAVVDKRWRN